MDVFASKLGSRHEFKKLPGPSDVVRISSASIFNILVTKASLTHKKGATLESAGGESTVGFEQTEAGLGRRLPDVAAKGSKTRMFQWGAS